MAYYLKILFSLGLWLWTLVLEKRVVLLRYAAQGAWSSWSALMALWDWQLVSQYWPWLLLLLE